RPAPYARPARPARPILRGNLGGMTSGRAMNPSEPSRGLSMARTHRLGAAGRDERLDQVIEEAPVALLYNGVPFAVMMATPCDLDDFALGFALAEGIVES